MFANIPLRPRLLLWLNPNPINAAQTNAHTSNPAILASSHPSTDMARAFVDREAVLFP